MDDRYTWNSYVADVSSGRVVACSAVKDAAKRHLVDLEKAKKRDFPYCFDEERARLAVDFFYELRHSKGKWAGQKFVPEPWQQFIIASLYGWRQKTTGLRRFRKAYIQVARKNGKTFLGAGVELYDLITEPGAEVYSAATTRDQAKISFNDAKRMVQKSPELQEYIKSFRDTLVCGDGVFKALSADDSTLDGLNPSCSLVDEYHAHKDDSIVGVIQTGMGSREQPLLFIITTAGFSTASVCHEEYEIAKHTIAGDNGYENDEYFAIIFELDKSDNWKDRKVWIKANPNLGVSVSVEYMESQLKEAMQKTSKEGEFKTKNLNYWVSSKEGWISFDKWKRSRALFDEKTLAGRTCFGAIDLSKILDFTALTWYFWIEELGKFYAKHRFYIPEEQVDIKLKTDSPQIRKWIERGYITAIPGETIDYDFMRNDIYADAELYEIKEIAYDPYLAKTLITELKDQFLLVEMQQQIKKLSEPSKNWEKMVTDGKLIDNNPVMEWMVGCAEIYTDANGNIKVQKPKANRDSKRIDGVITSIMAHERARIWYESNSGDSIINNILDMIY
ncbi:MAG: terminase large subunit [Treponema sp.]|nr:MAG: terminase large subunit [Treponema sp.]